MPLVVQNRENPDELQHHFDFIYGVQIDDNPTQALARFRQNENLQKKKANYAIQKLNLPSEGSQARNKWVGNYYSNQMEDGQE